MPKIQRLIRGQAPSLVDADKGNELIEMINGILKSRGRDPIKLDVSSDGSITLELDANRLDGIIVIDGEATTKTIFVQNATVSQD